MSKRIESPKSLAAAVAYALGLSRLPNGDVELQHNVGACGSCAAAGAPSCVCQGTPSPAVMGGGVPPGWSVGAGGVLIAPSGATVDPATGAVTPPPLGAELPAGPAFNAQMWNQYVANFRNMRCVPYEDAVRDGLMMSIVQSDPTTIAAGVTANVDIQALNGWVDGYYLDISARTAAGAALPPEAISLTPPRNVGCPVPACTRDVATSGRFFRSDQGCCLGKPYRSILTEQANGTPLRAAVTNHTAADAIIQIAVRGFCVSTRVCV